MPEPDFALSFFVDLTPEISTRCFDLNHELTVLANDCVMCTQTEERVGIRRDQKQEVEAEDDRHHETEEKVGIHAAGFCHNERQKKHGQTKDTAKEHVDVERSARDKDRRGKLPGKDIP